MPPVESGAEEFVAASILIHKPSPPTAKAGIVKRGGGEGREEGTWEEWIFY